MGAFTVTDCRESGNASIRTPKEGLVLTAFPDDDEEMNAAAWLEPGTSAKNIVKAKNMNIIVTLERLLKK